MPPRAAFEAPGAQRGPEGPVDRLREPCRLVLEDRAFLVSAISCQQAVAAELHPVGPVLVPDDHRHAADPVTHLEEGRT